jgi:hypothetical protein
MKVKELIDVFMNNSLYSLILELDIMAFGFIVVASIFFSVAIFSAVCIACTETIFKLKSMVLKFNKNRSVK